MDTSRLKLKKDFLTFLDLSYKKSNLGLTIKLERKLLTTAIFFFTKSHIQPNLDSR